MVRDRFQTGLRRARLERGLSQTELANRIGTSKNTVIAWELGRSKPTYQQFLALCTFLGWPHPFRR